MVPMAAVVLAAETKLWQVKATLLMLAAVL